MTRQRRRQTGRQAFSFRVIGSSSARVEERLTDNGDIVVVQVFGEPLLGYGLLIELDISLSDEVVLGLITRGPSSSAAVRMAVSLLTSRKSEGERQKEDAGS